MNTQNAATAANRSISTIRRWCRTRKILAKKTNAGRWDIDQASLYAHIGTPTRTATASALTRETIQVKKGRRKGTLVDVHLVHLTAARVISTDSGGAHLIGAEVTVAVDGEEFRFVHHPEWAGFDLTTGDYIDVTLRDSDSNEQLHERYSAYPVLKY